jgi:hypothetical protein
MKLSFRLMSKKVTHRNGVQHLQGGLSEDSLWHMGMLTLEPGSRFYEGGVQ